MEQLPDNHLFNYLPSGPNPVCGSVGVTVGVSTVVVVVVVVVVGIVEAVPDGEEVSVVVTGTFDDSSTIGALLDCDQTISPIIITTITTNPIISPADASPFADFNICLKIQVIE